MNRLLAIAALSSLVAACGDGSDGPPKQPERDAPLTDDLSWLREMAPGGALAYSADREIYIVELDEGAKPKKVGRGFMPEFSPDGSKLAWADNDRLSVCNRDGTGTRQLHNRMFKHGGAHWLDNESIAAILNGPDGYRWYRFWLDGRRQPMPELDQFGISKEQARETDVRQAADGVWTHVAYRSWKTSDGGGGAIDGGCSCSISPDGKSITALQGNHTELYIRPVREGGITHDLKWLYEGRFDNHRWSSNDERFLVCVREKPARMVVIDWQSGRASAFGRKGHKDKTRMYGDLTNSDGKAGAPMPPLLPPEKREGATADEATDRGEPVVLEQWPYRTEGMAFMFESRSSPNEFREFANDPPKKSTGQLRGKATYDRFGRIDLTGGHYEVTSDVALASDFSLELVVEPTSTAKGVIASIGEIAFSLKDGELQMVLNRDGSIPKPLAEIPNDRPSHLVICNGNGMLSSYLNGAQLGAFIAPEIKFASPPAISFGNGFSGTVEAIAIFDRVISVRQAERRYELIAPRLAQREPAPRRLVEAKLVQYTPPIPLAEMDTYRRLVCEHLFEVVSVLRTEEGATGPSAGDKIRVRAWATLDMEILPELWKGSEGKTFPLVLEPEGLHPYLETKERIESALDFDTADLPGFFHTARP